MFKSPNSKTLTGAAISVGAGVVGAKLGDGLVAVLPDSVKPNTKRVGVLVAALIGASAVNPTTTSGRAVQSAFIGMAIKQGADALTTALKPTIEARTGGTTADKFINAVVGHEASLLNADTLLPDDLIMSRNALGVAAWEDAMPVNDESPVSEAAPDKYLFV